MELKERIDARHKRSCPCVLVGNKSDLAHMRRVSEEEATEAATRLGCSYFETSAASPRHGEVEAVFFAATRLAVERLKQTMLSNSQNVATSIKSVLRWVKQLRRHSVATTSSILLDSTAQAAGLTA